MVQTDIFDVKCRYFSLENGKTASVAFLIQTSSIVATKRTLGLNKSYQGRSPADDGEYGWALGASQRLRLSERKKVEENDVK